MGVEAQPASLSAEGKRAGRCLPLLPIGMKEGRQREIIQLGEEPR